MTVEAIKPGLDPEDEINTQILLKKKIFLQLVYDRQITDPDQISRITRHRLSEERERKQER